VYQLRPPAPELRPYIEHYWFVEQMAGEALDLRVDVFVDARADLIFNFGVAYTREVIGGVTSQHAASNLDAQRTVPIRIVQRGAVVVCGVRFHLGGLGAFTRTALAPWTGLTPAPAEVLGEGATALEATLGAQADHDARARALDRFFLERLQLDPSYLAFASTLAELTRCDGQTTVEALSHLAGTSARQVERGFARHLGIPPKTVARILRFQRAMRALMRDPGGALADVAADAGYFDQAHFVRDFRRMTGGVPRGYRGYFPPAGPSDFAPNVVVFVQDEARRPRRT